MPKSSLEKAVTKKVKQTKDRVAREAAEAARVEAEFSAKLPHTREERAKLVFPSITDGEWEYRLDGHWELHFIVQGIDFDIHPRYICYDAGTPTEGYGPTEAHWENYLYVKPRNEYRFELGRVGDVDDIYLAAMNDPNNSDRGALSKKRFAELVMEVNDRIARLVEGFLTNMDDYSYMAHMRHVRTCR